MGRFTQNWTLIEDVCGDCNQYFGSEIETQLAHGKISRRSAHEPFTAGLSADSTRPSRRASRSAQTVAGGVPGDMIGRTLSHYRITAAIGAGGMGEVHRATDTNRCRDGALEVSPRELASNAASLDASRSLACCSIWPARCPRHDTLC